MHVERVVVAQEEVWVELLKHVRVLSDGDNDDELLKIAAGSHEVRFGGAGRD